MRDQAEKLRMKMMEQQGQLGKSVAIVSGKGGVGKSNFTTNFAILLAKQGKKVVIVDMDIGMANVHLLLGSEADYHLKDYLEGRASLQDVIIPAPYQFHYISGGSGFTSVVEWTEEMFEALIHCFEQLQKNYDFILFDMGAGATNWSLDLIMSIDEIIVITTSEPTAITDAYSMMKYIHLKDEEKTYYLVCNRTYSKEEGEETIQRLKNTMAKFLKKEAFSLGLLPEDAAVRKAVIKQVPFTIDSPNAPASKALQQMVDRFVHGESINKSPVSTTYTFLWKLKRIFMGRA